MISWLDDGAGSDSDLLSLALGESGLDLATHGQLGSLERSETGLSGSGMAGASLSLESTSTPNDLLNWASLLSNTNSQNLGSTQDDFSNLFEPFNEFRLASEDTAYNKTSKPSISKDLPDDLNIYFGPGDFSTQQTVNRTNSTFDSTLKDLLSTENGFSSNSLTKKAVNGLNVNIKDPIRKYVMNILRSK